MATVLSQSQVVLTALFLSFPIFSAGSVLPPAFVRRQTSHNFFSSEAHFFSKSLISCTSNNDCHNDGFCHAGVCSASTFEPSSQAHTLKSRSAAKTFTKRGLGTGASVGLSIAIPTLVMLAVMVLYFCNKRRKARMKHKHRTREWIVTPYNPTDVTIPTNPPAPPLPPSQEEIAARKLSAASTPSTIYSDCKEDYFEQPGTLHKHISNPPPPPPPPVAASEQTKGAKRASTLTVGMTFQTDRPMTPAELEGCMPAPEPTSPPLPPPKNEDEIMDEKLEPPHFPNRNSTYSFSEVTDVSSLYSPREGMSPTDLPSPPEAHHRPLTSYHEVIQPPPAASPKLSPVWAPGDDSPTLGRTTFAVSMMVPSNKRPSLLQQISASSIKNRYSQDNTTADSYKGRPLTAMQQKTQQQQKPSTANRLSSTFSNFNMRASSARQSRFPVRPARSPLGNLWEADSERSPKGPTVNITRASDDVSSSAASVSSAYSDDGLGSPRSATTDDIPSPRAMSAQPLPSPRSRSQGPPTRRSHLVRQSSGLRRMESVRYNEPASTTPINPAHEIPPLPPANMPLPPAASATRMTTGYTAIIESTAPGSTRATSAMAASKLGASTAGHARNQSMGTSVMRVKRMTIFNQPVIAEQGIPGAPKVSPPLVRAGRTGRV